MVPVVRLLFLVSPTPRLVEVLVVVVAQVLGEVVAQVVAELVVVVAKREVLLTFPRFLDSHRMQMVVARAAAWVVVVVARAVQVHQMGPAVLV